MCDGASLEWLKQRTAEASNIQAAEAEILIWPLLSSEGTVFFREITNMVCALCGALHRTGNATRGEWLRRWIILISADWVPHYISSSRGCLALGAEIIQRTGFVGARIKF